jgi:hypothetical protein
MIIGFLCSLECGNLQWRIKTLNFYGTWRNINLINHTQVMSCVSIL